MADLQDPYARSRLILEYLRAFAWPLVVLLILVVYRQDLVQLVSEREFEAFGGASARASCAGRHLPSAPG